MVNPGLATYDEGLVGDPTCVTCGPLGQQPWASGFDRRVAFGDRNFVRWSDFLNVLGRRRKEGLKASVPAHDVQGFHFSSPGRLFIVIRGR